MHIIVMNNDNFITIHLRTVVQYIMKCEATTKIYSVHNLFNLCTLSNFFILNFVLY